MVVSDGLVGSGDRLRNRGRESRPDEPGRGWGYGEGEAVVCVVLRGLSRQ